MLFWFISVLYRLQIYGFIVAFATSPCEQQIWPELELMLPLSFNSDARAYEWRDVFLRSYLLFWPLETSKTKLLFMIDEEAKNHPRAEILQSHINSLPRLKGNARIGTNNVPAMYYGFDGWKRQQYLMFYADNFTNSEYVGFVDTDCLFITFIDRNDLFEYRSDGNDSTKKTLKPVINGRSGFYFKAGQKEMPVNLAIARNTFDVTGLLEPLRCMSYWPVIIKLNHIQAFRAFLEKKYNLPFYELHRLYIAPHLFGQFNLWCAYLYYYHHDEYIWYIHDISPGWDFNGATYGQQNNNSIYRPEMYEPKPRVALHTRHHVPMIVTNDSLYYQILQQGICFSPPFPKLHPTLQYHCAFYNSTKHYQQVINEDMFKFERFRFYVTHSEQKLQQVMYSRFQRIENCSFEIPEEEIKVIFMTSPYNQVKEGGVYYIEGSKSLYTLYNGSIRAFGNWDTFVNMGFQHKPRIAVTAKILFSGHWPTAGPLSQG